MRVRTPRGDDFAMLAAITNNHYIATTAVHFAHAPIAEAELCAQWQRDRERWPWWVADDGGTALGYAKAGTWRARAAYQWTTELGLYVAAPARGRGIGRALYAALLDELPRRGFRSAIAGITLPNDASIALHRAFGFASVGIVEDAGWKHGRWHAVEFWQKRFATDTMGPPGS